MAAILLTTCAARGQEQYFERPSFKPHFTFHWDALARYDAIDHLRVRPDIERGRFELRPELDLEFSDRFLLGVRAVGDLGTDSNEENARNFDNYRSRGSSIERYYLVAKPGAWVLHAGSFGMPLVATEMLWDHDIQTAGLAAQWQVPAGSSTLTLAAAIFRGPQREGDRTRLAAGQLVWRAGDPGRLAIEAAVSYWHIDPERLKPAYIRQNYSVLRGGNRDYLSLYRILDGLLRLRFFAGSVPMTISLDALVNTGVREEAADDDTAFEGIVAAGRVGIPGDWRVFYTYQYVARDAVLGAYNTDDWWFHSWYQGHRAGVAFTVLPRLFVQGTVTFQRRLDLKSTLNRVTVDLVKMF